MGRDSQKKRKRRETRKKRKNAIRSIHPQHGSKASSELMNLYLDGLVEDFRASAKRAGVGNWIDIKYVGHTFSWKVNRPDPTFGIYRKYEMDALMQLPDERDPGPRIGTAEVGIAHKGKIYCVIFSEEVYILMLESGHAFDGLCHVFVFSEKGLLERYQPLVEVKTPLDILLEDFDIDEALASIESEQHI